MKLSKALIEKAEGVKRFTSIADRVCDISIYGKDKFPDENAACLFQLFEMEMEKQYNLECRINKTYYEVKLYGMSLADAISRLECLEIKIDFYRTQKYLNNFRAGGELRKNFERTVYANELQEIINKLSREYEELDAKIQRLKQTADLM